MSTRIYEPKSENERFRLEQICGDCLEGAGLSIPHQAYAIIEQGADVNIGDLVHCTEHTGTLSSYIKQVKEINGDSIIVGTEYTDKSKDYTFEAAEIFGVVKEVYCRLFGTRVYARGE